MREGNAPPAFGASAAAPSSARHVRGSGPSRRRHGVPRKRRTSPQDPPWLRPVRRAARPVPRLARHANRPATRSDASTSRHSSPTRSPAGARTLTPLPPPPSPPQHPHPPHKTATLLGKGPGHHVRCPHRSGDRSLSPRATHSPGRRATLWLGRGEVGGFGGSAASAKSANRASGIPTTTDPTFRGMTTRVPSIVGSSVSCWPARSLNTNHASLLRRRCGRQRCTRAPAPLTRARTSANVAEEVSPGVVIARAP